jgi:FkbM family methyltransferase
MEKQDEKSGDMGEIFKTVDMSAQWTDKKEWLFPAHDRRMDRCFRPGDKGDYNLSMAMILPLLKNKRNCIQAGGCVGVWPYRLSQMFNHVTTVELHPDNFQCLMQNCNERNNITAYNAALWSSDDEMMDVCLADTEKGNAGAYYVRPGDTVRTMTIDDLSLPDVDLIYLDIEGSEYDALLGGMETINKYMPVIGLEDKGHHKIKRHPVSLLLDIGYKIIGKPFSLDIVLA